ncbi:DUF1028 domain-containing protein [Cryobacterium tepidiphilum]|uniref:DUF1028 domain-containing protein n=1 Tax=Cryobacterium tepidiphilum TaxID=2486026 RepID=A0A3M8L383_9MICO|nr:DUF1028 domain-containing protein [Cryobacterium tepidiphilum]RNE59192.1 DUF1028 domain-containing protein [Cryobacterium tepidiphilum]
MTFSLLAVDDTGAIGSAICSSSPAVAARCVSLADGIGGAHSQNITDPRLGPQLIDGLRDGRTVDDVLAAIVESTPDIDYRQLLVIDRTGRSAIHSGAHVLGTHGQAYSAHAVAAGNMLASAEIPQLMVEAFDATMGDLELRLLAALQAAVSAGGEEGPVRSAGIAVVRDAGWRVTDVRVDWADDPVETLGQILVATWLPQRDAYVTRGLTPAGAPTYGVPGDE